MKENEQEITMLMHADSNRPSEISFANKRRNAKRSEMQKLRKNFPDKL